MNIKENEIDHKYTDNMICPYCGAEDVDSWECLPGEEDIGNVECGDCGRTYIAERNISITYSTYEINWLEEWKRMNDRTIRKHEADERYEIWVANARPLSGIVGDARTPQH